MVVIDASVINKVFLPNEEGHERAKEIIQKHLEKSEEISVPNLLFFEVANTLVTKTVIPEDEILQTLLKLGKLKLLVIYPTIETFMKIAKFARKYHVSVYDASYAVLAEEKNCDLITADEKFAKQVNLPFVKLLSS